METRLFLFLALLTFCNACSNFLITKSASSNNSTMISYNADSEELYGCLWHTAAGTWPDGTMLKIYDWDSAAYLGEIAQAPVTYQVIGNMNEHQVAITETTFGGLDQLSSQPTAKVDYGSLIYLALSRAQTAREAIQVMGSLTATYGYYSEGESFSIADLKEVWILEMIGKGQYELGSVWVAMRIPDGYVAGHANQARIRTFPLNDSNNCLYASDVIQFARKIGLYNGSDADFSFSDTYDPVTFEGARFCEARVWSMFNKVTTGMDQYLDYVQGYNLTNRMPLYVKPNKGIALTDIQGFMGDHYENTWFAFSQDVGAEAFHAPYRWRPLTWSVDGKDTYVNERSAGTEQTGFTMVAQIRDWMPNPIGGILWFCPDDGSTAIYAPMYVTMTEVPKPYECDWYGSGPNGNMSTFDVNKAFWAFNLVANWAYFNRYNQIQPEITTKQKAYQSKFATEIPQIDSIALSMFATDPKSAISFLTSYSVNTANDIVKDWQSFFGYIFVKYNDGYVKTFSPNQWNPIVAEVGYDNTWYQRIIDDTGTHYLEPSADPERGATYPGGSRNGLRKLRFI